MTHSNTPAAGPRWLKAELHAHCSQDPSDYKLCAYTPEQLIRRARDLRYDVLAITCHDQDIWTPRLGEYAESLGIILVPGMEVTTEGAKHTLVYNFRTGAANLNTLAKIRERMRPDTVVIAPHPYFPSRTCLRSLLEQNIDMFDAIEVSGFHTNLIDFNRAARQIARKYGKPVVGNGDVHQLWQLGPTHTLIYSEPNADSILSAVKQGLVRIHSQSLTHFEVTRWWATALWRTVFPANRSPRRPGIVGLGLPDYE